MAKKEEERRVVVEIVLHAYFRRYKKGLLVEEQDLGEQTIANNDVSTDKALRSLVGKEPKGFGLEYTFVRNIYEGD